MGDKDEAVKLARQASNVDNMQVQPLANLADILWQTDQKDAAREILPSCARSPPQIDLDCAVFRRLAPIATDLNLPADWRVPLVTPTDVGVRPELASLGPFRWQPTTAPTWSLPDSAGKMHALADYHGQPVLVVFYLGSLCSHCIEQLNIFRPTERAICRRRDQGHRRQHRFRGRPAKDFCPGQGCAGLPISHRGRS